MNETMPERYIDQHVGALIDDLELAHNEQSIRFALQRFATHAGFEKFAYANLKGANSRVYSNYPDEWLDQYLAGNYFAIDPVVTTAKRSLQPFVWSGERMVRQGGEVKRIAMEADLFGIRAGISIPIRAGFGATAMLTLASGKPDAADVAFRDAIAAATAVAFLHGKISQLAAEPLKGADILLSPRELTCLAWASDGKTKAETATMIGIKEKTVRFYLEEARKKLGARNISHAVRIATLRKLF